MNKWADYLISAVRYDEERNHITHLKVHSHKESDGVAYLRSTVITLISVGNTFNTMYKDNGQWKNGARVQVITVDGEDYLRTDSNNIKRDNLGELPEF